MEFVPATPVEDEVVDRLSAQLEELKITHTLDRITLLRFLRGRKGVEDKALESIRNHIQWRIDNNVDGITEECIQKELSSRKGYIGGKDREGKPVVFVFARRHSAYDRDINEIRNFIIYLLERVLKESNPQEQRMLIVFDLAHFTMSCMDYEAVKLLISILQYHYPDTLAAAYIVNEPWIFGACWRIIKGWLDPVTAQKIHFCKTEKLTEAMDASVVPEDIGSQH